MFIVKYGVTPVVHNQSPPTSDLIPSTDVLPADKQSSDLRIICNFKHLSISDLFQSITFDKMYIHSITYLLKSLFQQV